MREFEDRIERLERRLAPPCVVVEWDGLPDSESYPRKTGESVEAYRARLPPDHLWVKVVWQ